MDRTGSSEPHVMTAQVQCVADGMQEQAANVQYSSNAMPIEGGVPACDNRQLNVSHDQTEHMLLTGRVAGHIQNKGASCLITFTRQTIMFHPLFTW